MKKRPQSSGGDIPEWVVTFGDLMSLLLCFFILLAAFSELKKPKEYARAAEALSESLGFAGGLGVVIARRNPRNSNRSHLRESARMAGESQSRSDINEQNITGRDETVSTIHEGNRWQIGGTIGFEPGSWALSDADKQTLIQAAEMIKGQTRKVLLRGHSFGVADKTAGLDHKDLSYRRARAAADFLSKELGVRDELLLVVAVGDAEPIEVKDAFDGSGTAQNRRVEIMITEVMHEELHPDPEWQKD